MDIYALIWGALLRMAQALVAASPTILVGWLIAAIFERILGREGTYQLFGGNSWRQLPQAWLLGMLLPVCSLGVIPVMVQMRKSGISGGTILAFGLTAPLFNPISVLYGLTLSDPWAIFVFCMCSLTLITIMGILWDRLFPNSALPAEPIRKTPYGIRRVGAVALSIFHQATSVSSIYIGIAILGVGVLSIALPAGTLQRAAGKDDLLAPLTMAAVSTLAYVTPMTAIVQVASMFQHGNSIAASFTLLTLGTGINLGMILWIAQHYRLKPTAVWLGCLVATVLVMSYGIDRPLSPKGVEPADHTHAFDGYCNPFVRQDTNLPANAWRILRENTNAAEIIATGTILCILTFGMLFRAVDPHQQWMAALCYTTPKSDATESTRGFPPRGFQDIVLPNSVIAGISIISLVIASVGACFLYYPPVSEIRKEMNSIEAELIGSYNRHEWEKLEYWIPIQEDWAHKLVVSAYLRGRPLDRYTQMKLQVYKNKLELLEHATEDRDVDEAKEFGKQAALAFRRLKEAI